jgi:hypothetical protein
MIDMIMPSQCHITLSDQLNQDNKLVLDFNIFPTDIAHKWQQLVTIAQRKNYQIDDPKRFYGLNDKPNEIAAALDKINNNINTINSYIHIIDRHLDSIMDQDTLNYLHHIFEEYHGLLDQQDTVYWNNASVEVRQALADLNVCVHRIESLQRGNQPRFVVTYFQLPKTEKLNIKDYNCLTDCYEFGGLYLNYVEIGKTLEELMKDNDQYIHDDAFKPWEYFSADFRVTLSDNDTIESRINRENCLSYFRKHRQFFESRGFKEYDPRLRPGYIYIGKMIHNNKESILSEIKKRQYVSAVDFS